MSNDYQEFTQEDFAVMRPKRNGDQYSLMGKQWHTVEDMLSPTFSVALKYRRLRSLLTPEQVDHFKRKEAMKPCPENNTQSLCNAAGDTKAADISEADIVITDEVKLISHLQNNGFGYLAHDTLEELLRVLDCYKSKTKPAEISDDEAFDKWLNANYEVSQLGTIEINEKRLVWQAALAWRDARK